MIKFTCANCNKVLKVSSEHSGKKGRCPRCKNVLVVPHSNSSTVDISRDVKEESTGGPDAQKKTTIDFKCSMCEKVIEALESSRGKLKECPQCGCYVEVPKKEEKVVESSPCLELQLKEELPVGSAGGENTSNGYAEGLGQYLNLSERTEEIPGDYARKFPWLIDIFCYPTSSAGLLILGIVILGPAIMDLILAALIFFGIGVLTQLIWLVLLIVFFFIRITLWLYGYWYFSVCIEESARGKTRAPEILTMDTDDNVFGLFVNMLRLVCCLLICMGPSLVYWWNTKEINEILWILLAVGVFFLPMTLLRVVMYDSLAGLNPFIIVWSIFKLFPRYCLVLLFFYLPMVLFVFMARWVPKDLWGGRFILKAANMYLLLVSAHVLGWFYYRNEERLAWPV